MSTRNVYLFSIPLRNARPHWTIWIPLDSDSIFTFLVNPNGVGKRIEAVGALQFGFKIEVEHAFDWSKMPTGRMFLLGTADSSNIMDLPQPTKTTDLNKNDAFERVAAQLDAPRAVGSDVMPTGSVFEVAAALQHDIPGMRRCQEWTMGYVGALVKAGLLPDEAVNVVAEARKLNPFPPAD